MQGTYYLNEVDDRNSGKIMVPFRVHLPYSEATAPSLLEHVQTPNIEFSQEYHRNQEEDILLSNW